MNYKYFHFYNCQNVENDRLDMWTKWKTEEIQNGFFSTNREVEDILGDQRIDRYSEAGTGQ
jgi:hypothetical protein